MRLSRRTWLTCLALYLIGQIFFLINIGFPAKQNFDEFHYVPAAKSFLELKESRNYEHPPLAKELMAVSIGVFGDNPLGWRFISTVFGSITLVGMYLWGLAVFGNQAGALLVASLTMVNQLLYVQSRIGMLDTFMMAFLSLAAAGFCAFWKSELDARVQRKLLLVTGICLGLATSCKWFAVIPWVGFLGLIALIRLFQSWNTRFAGVDSPKSPLNRDHNHNDGPEEFYSPALWQNLSLRDFIIYLGIVPCAAYFATFLPFLFFTKADGNGTFEILDLFKMQYRMWDGQMRVVTPHPYGSLWHQWPLMNRPIWYAFDKEGDTKQWVRGVVLLGNPWIMWGGLLALLYSFWEWVKTRSRSAFLILAFYGMFMFSWPFVPRKLSFYYYYYPAGMTLSLAMTQVLQCWNNPAHLRHWRIAAATMLLIAFVLFVYFFPILSGELIPSDSFRKWMWMRRWI